MPAADAPPPDDRLLSDSANGFWNGLAAALWSQNATVTMRVTAETLPSPVLKCSQGTNPQNVVVTWTPQRAGATSNDVTVTRDGSTERSGSTSNTSETITAPGGLNLIYTYTYAVTVEAHYGTWEAKPVAYSGVLATKPLLGIASISCPGS